MNKINTKNELLEDLKDLNVELKEIIFFNPKKQRYTLLVKNNKKLNVLKWNHPSEETHTEKLQKEIKFYEEQKNSEFFPEIIFSNENIMMIEFVDSENLRQWLINYLKQNGRYDENITDEFKRVLESIINYFIYYFRFSKTSNPTSYNSDDVKDFHQYFNRLVSSGPMDNRVSHFETYILKFTKLLIRKKVKKILSNILLLSKDSNIPLYKFKVHGDLHLNNILVHDSQIKIIDWENLSDSNIFVDINYFCVMFLHLLEKYPTHQKYVSEKFYSFFDEYFPEYNQLFLNLNELFYIGISVNRRFGFNLKFKDFVINLLSLSSKLNDFSKKIRVIQKSNHTN